LIKICIVPEGDVRKERREVSENEYAEKCRKFVEDEMKKISEQAEKIPSPCWRCGKEHLFIYEPTERVYCPECRQAKAIEHEAKVKQYVKLKMDLMLERALCIMERSGKVSMDSIREPFERLSKRFEQGEEEYKSGEEVVAALILMDNGFEFEANKRIGRYVVDFYIPKLKAILEIDGREHDLRTIYDSKRDLEIRQSLPPDWEIVRIKTEFVAVNPSKIPEAVEQMRNEKQRIRKEHGGIIPEHFSAREKDLYKAVQFRRGLAKLGC
jgi:very-short-patch-repair endonuclease